MHLQPTGAFAVNFGAFPANGCLRRLNKKYKKLRITCQADDTYLGGHHSFIYDAFDETRIDQREACTLESNVKKLKAFSVNHGVTNVPQYIRDAQGGYTVGFKCVSAFVGPDTAEGTAWKIDMLTKTFEKKLIYLDALDALPKHLSDKDAPGLKHYQYNYLSRCANTMPTYFQRLMPPPAFRGGGGNFALDVPDDGAPTPYPSARRARTLGDG